jgi:hypothetical protein
VTDVRVRNEQLLHIVPLDELIDRRPKDDTATVKRPQTAARRASHPTIP